MQKLGVPINKEETIALAVAHLIHKGMASNGQGILIQADQMAESEAVQSPVWGLDWAFVSSSENLQLPEGQAGFAGPLLELVNE
jgi:hypothetical protein